jgi:hypothetical protein
MSTSEEPLSTIEGHVDALSERIRSLERSIDERFDDVCRRLDGVRAWLIALTGLYAVQLAGLIALTVVLSRLGR